MKTLLLLIFACLLCMPASTDAASVVLLDSTSAVYHDSEYGDSAVFTFAFQVSSGTDNLYMSNDTFSSVLTGIPGLGVSFTGIDEEHLDVFAYVSFEDVLALGDVYYLAANRSTEMYLTLSVQTVQSGILGALVNGFAFNTGGPVVPSQPYDIGPLVNLGVNASADSVSLSSIPEPSAVSLAFASLLVCFRRKRRILKITARARERRVFSLIKTAQPRGCAVIVLS